MSYLSHLECGMCNEILDPDKIWNLCPKCGKPLLARYDMESAKGAFSKEMLKDRAPNLWRYGEMLPLREEKYRLCLGEGFTLMKQAKRLGEEIGFEGIFIKDEGLNPTTSFKARGLGMAVSRAYELGVKEVVTLIDGLITDCGKAAAEGVKKYGRFDISTLKEPYRIEGKKTMGYEVAEQMDWILPDVIIYPTGGGTGLVGMWKAFDEMETLGWIGSKRPRMVTVQADGCAPMVRAFEQGDEFAKPWEGAKTVADGLRVPAAVGDFLIQRALRESNGAAVAVSDEELMADANLIGRTEGIFACPEGGATLTAFKKLREQGWISDNETVILFNTGSGHKYEHLWAE